MKIRTSWLRGVLTSRAFQSARPLDLAFGAALVLSLIVLPCESSAELTFTGDQLLVYFSALETETGPCSFRCGATSSCWGQFTVTETNLTLFSQYDGPGPCTYCSCCSEAEAYAIGLVNVILFVDPLTGLPLSRFAGGRAVRIGIPPGSSIRLGGLYSAYHGAYWDGSYQTAAYLALGYSCFLAMQEFCPVCGDHSLSWFPLAGDRMALDAGIYVGGNNCSQARASLSLSDPIVIVPADRLVPDDEALLLSAGETRTRIRVANTSPRPWQDVRLCLFGPDGSLIDSVYTPVLPPLSEIHWTVTASPRHSLRLSAQEDLAALRAAVRPELLYWGFSPLAPHLVLGGESGNGVRATVMKQQGRSYARSRSGTVEAEFSVSESLGVAIVPSSLRFCVSTEFDAGVLAPEWFVENPSAPASRISLTERPGFLRIVATQSDGGADWCGCSNFRAPRLTQSVAGDWVLETRLEFAPSDLYEAAGIFIDGGCAAGRVCDGGGQRVYCLGDFMPSASPVTYFRIQQRGDSLMGFWSSDGVNWSFGGGSRYRAKAVGLFAARKNWSPGGDHDAVADFAFFRITSTTATEVGPLAVAPVWLLAPPRPNPATSAITLDLSVAEGGEAEVAVFDVTGRRLRLLHSGVLAAGQHSFTWDGHDVNGQESPSGVYFLRIRSGSQSESRRLVLLR